jgi:diguanylate cyclase (GGDEF)-like protein
MSDELPSVPVRSGAGNARHVGTNTATTKLVLDLVGERLGSSGVEDVLERAGLGTKRELLRTYGGRIPYEEKVRLMDAAAAALGDPRFGLTLAARAQEDPLFASFRLLIRSMGSPLVLLRGVARFSPSFDSTAVMRFVSSTRNSAVVARRVLAPGGARRVDCDCVIGFLSQSAVMFGRPPAAVVQEQCQVDGDPECLYLVTWERSRRRPFRRRVPADSGGDDVRNLIGADERLVALQGAAEDMVSGGTVDDLLDRMINRADRVVHATGHAIMVQLPEGEVRTRVRGTGESFIAAFREDGVVDGQHPSMGGRPFITAPIISANRGFGSFVAMREPGQGFLHNERDTLITYANHVAVVLEMSVLLAEADRQRETSELLLDVARSLSTRSSVDQVSQYVAEAASHLSRADLTSISVWDPESGCLRTRGMAGVPDYLISAVRDFSPSPVESPELAALLSNTVPMFLDGHGSDWLRETLAVFGVDSVLVTPIVVDDQMLGVILAAWNEGTPPMLDPAREERLTGLAGLAAVALENARLVEGHRWQALHDPLTLLPNRRYFEDRFRDAHAEAVRTQQRVGVLYCDVNSFKTINDTYGHGVGDSVLANVAARLNAAVRDGDLVARLSGDEFVILASTVQDDDELVRIAERVQAQLEEPVITTEGLSLTVGISIGMALSGGPDNQHQASAVGTAAPGPVADATTRPSGFEDDPVRRILALADHHMYEAKAKNARTRWTDLS